MVQLEAGGDRICCNHEKSNAADDPDVLAELHELNRSAASPAAAEGTAVH